MPHKPDPNYKPFEPTGLEQQRIDNAARVDLMRGTPCVHDYRSNGKPGQMKCHKCGLVIGVPLPDLKPIKPLPGQLEFTLETMLTSEPSKRKRR